MLDILCATGKSRIDQSISFAVTQQSRKPSRLISALLERHVVIQSTFSHPNSSVNFIENISMD